MEGSLTQYDFQQISVWIFRKIPPKIGTFLSLLKERNTKFQNIWSVGKNGGKMEGKIFRGAGNISRDRCPRCVEPL